MYIWLLSLQSLSTRDVAKVTRINVDNENVLSKSIRIRLSKTWDDNRLTTR